MTTCCPAFPKARSFMSLWRVWRASCLSWQIKTPLPEARPSALMTQGDGMVSNAWHASLCDKQRWARAVGMLY